MEPRIALITIICEDVPAVVQFYRDLLGFTVIQDLGVYVEFASPGVRFAVCNREVLLQASGGHAEYQKTRQGQPFELAFPCGSPEEVDAEYARLTAAGAVGITPPADMPWGQHTALFADPAGNIHELFADLPGR